jgi:hypothetical protein
VLTRREKRRTECVGVLAYGQENVEKKRKRKIHSD